MEWKPIDTVPMDTPVLVYGKDLYGHFVVTGATKDLLCGWEVLGSGGHECDVEIEPTHWAYPEPPNVEVRLGPTTEGETK